MSSNETDSEGVWFVYDGNCPVCSYAAQALRIRKRFGSLHLLNARDGQAHPLLAEISRQGLDLDAGMVICHSGRFYHGDGALQFMARHGAPHGPFNWFNKSLFWSDSLAKLIYPWMRGTRNRLLRLRGVLPIDNLDRNGQPIFQAIFGADWNKLPAVIPRHYANRPYSTDRVCVAGTLDVMCHGPVRWFRPLFLLLGMIPPFNEADVPVTVVFESSRTSRDFHFNRTFHFAGRKHYRFRSRMRQLAGDEVVELMRFGIGWKMRYLWKDDKVILQHQGYVLNLFGHYIPLPLTALFGAGHAEETAVDDDTFDMWVEIRHPWWGRIYGYSGRFRISEDA
ncbi:MAG TPA: DUF4166 domain-containing protein [Gammaproteobacteria bacterium]|nr:DUF4166 domain-containing protein [Gammaproteobacteria bacterium]